MSREATINELRVRKLYVFHIESEQNMIAVVDDFIERKKSAAKI